MLHRFQTIPFKNLLINGTVSLDNPGFDGEC